MAVRGVDTFYRTALMRPFIPKIFANGLGNPKLLESLISDFQYLRDPDFVRNFFTGRFGREHQIHTQLAEKPVRKGKQFHVFEFKGSFQSPFNELLHNCMPAVTRTAHFTMLVPQDAAAGRPPPSLEHRSSVPSCPMVLHLAGTGDYSVYLQREHALRLADLGVGSLLLVNPFYSPRRPPMQKSSSLLHLSDLFVMGGALILECWLLLRWLESRGFGPLSLHGVSMGGYMASLAASVHNRPLALVPCLSWTSSSPCYVRGVLSNSMAWETIQRQLASETALRERVWPLIRDASCPARCMVADNFPDPLRNSREASAAEAEQAAESGTETQLQSVYNRFYQTVADFGVGLFASTGRLVDTWKPNAWLSAKRQTQIADAMETEHRQQRQQPSTDRKLTVDEQEAREFVTCLLDYFTHLGNYEPPVGPVYSLQALDDAYIPRDGVYPLTELWPGIQCRVVKGGHVTTIFRNCYWSGKPHDLRDIVLTSVGLSPDTSVSHSAMP